MSDSLLHFTTGSFSRFPDVVCAMIDEHTLCGDAFDGPCDTDEDFGEWSDHHRPRAITCERCRSHILTVRKMRLSTKIVPARDTESLEDRG